MKKLLVLLIAAVVMSTPGLAQVFDSAEQIRPLLPGQTIPDVEFTQLDGSALSLQAAVAEKPTLLIFYRGGW